VIKPWIKIGTYCITCLINEKVYIGSAVNIRHRWCSHKRLLKLNQHYNKHLQNAWNLYKEENFKFNILEECGIEDLRIRELYFVNKFDALNPERGYNILEPEECFPHRNMRKFEILDPSGKLWKGINIVQFARDHGLNQSSLSGLITGYGNMKTYKGWRLPHTTLKVYKVLSPEGKEFEILWRKQSIFCKQHNLKFSGFCALLKGRQKEHRGWKLITT